jgi:hypothetical protein
MGDPSRIPENGEDDGGDTTGVVIIDAAMKMG